MLEGGDSGAAGPPRPVPPMTRSRWTTLERWFLPVALVAALACPRPAAAREEALSGAAVSGSLAHPHLVAIPSPPEPPRPPGRLPAPILTESGPADAPPGGAPADGGEPEATEAGGVEADRLPGLDFSDPVFEDPRADAWVGTVPRVAVPPYPLVVNGSVEALIDHFTARERDRFRLWLTRSGRYLDMIRRIFRHHGLPDELAYTAMIESGFSPRAVSRMGAKGLWQFMESTARRYGLTVNRWLDERLDPVKSTIAAARYLGDLYAIFGHWFLAQAAYNAGEARVARAIQRARTTDFWALSQTRHLPHETKLFVPQILAAAVITRDPARYGFDVSVEAPLLYDEVTVRRAMDLETLADLAGVGVEELRELNPALRADVTPPFQSYALRLPPGAGPRLVAALETAPPSRLVVWGVHRVGRRESLAEIARTYRTTPDRLAEVNQLRGGRLRGVSELLVPISNKVSPPRDLVGASRPGHARPTRSDARAARTRPGEVVVRRGDTLWGIAARYGLEPGALARLNGRELDDPLRPGDRLRIAVD